MMHLSLNLRSWSDREALTYHVSYAKSNKIFFPCLTNHQNMRGGALESKEHKEVNV